MNQLDIFSFKMYVIDLINLCHDFASAGDFLQSKRILRITPSNCSSCVREMTEVKKVGLKDGMIYRCPTHKTVTPR